MFVRFVNCSKKLTFLNMPHLFGCSMRLCGHINNHSHRQLHQTNQNSPSLHPNDVHLLVWKLKNKITPPNVTISAIMRYRLTHCDLLSQRIHLKSPNLHLRAASYPALTLTERTLKEREETHCNLFLFIIPDETFVVFLGRAWSSNPSLQFSDAGSA